MSDDLTGIFDGLSPEQARQLANHMLEEGRRKRQSLTQQNQPNERTNPMDDKFMESLTDEERQQMAQDLEASASKIKAAREGLRLAEIHKAYLAELQQIAATTSGDWKIRAITELKAKYRARGLQVI